MKKITFFIDYNEWLKKQYDLSNEEVNCLENVKFIFTLYGNDSCANCYALTDYDGNKLNINELSPFVNSVILSDCHKYFSDRRISDDANFPSGVMDIKCEEVFNMNNIKETQRC